ncbi:MAG: hypothetical protein AB1397_05825 [bacterium]
MDIEPIQKIYKLPKWQIVGFSILLFAGGLAILIFEKEIFYQIGGVLAILISPYIFYVLNNTKIIIDQECLISENYLSSWNRRVIKIRWQDIEAIHTPDDMIGSGMLTTYVISKIRDNKKRNKNGSIKITSSIKNYRELITEIYRRTSNASIDEKTKKVIFK